MRQGGGLGAIPAGSKCGADDVHFIRPKQTSILSDMVLPEATGPDDGYTHRFEWTLVGNLKQN